MQNLEPKGTLSSVALPLEPRPQPRIQVEADQDRRAVKRPRIGGVSTISVQPPSGLVSQVTLRVDDDPDELTTDEMDQEPLLARQVGSGSSEFGAETDAVCTTNPAGSTIGQSLGIRTLNPPLEAGDSDSAFLPVGLPRTSKNSLLRPSSRALIKEFFAKAETES